jgi:hypothetical protein
LPIGDLPISAEWLWLRTLGKLIVNVEEARMKIGNRQSAIGNHQ